MSQKHSTAGLALEAARKCAALTEMAHLTKSISSARQAHEQLLALENAHKKQMDTLRLCTERITRQSDDFLRLSALCSADINRLYETCHSASRAADMLAGAGSILDIFGTNQPKLPDLLSLLSSSRYASLANRREAGECKTLLSE
jgi:hypothetical protein